MKGSIDRVEAFTSIHDGKSDRRLPKRPKTSTRWIGREPTTA
jgi:hypothetical protein